ncbi:MAG: FAD-dependent oxidoreductase [Lachnospiraceae bacterium]|nr:FAD-dependent oxidoreductase [Lachnospiraceae bacterium]MBR6350051.1 FAD-dependent oxidoreductase [Lachnospiraceae bacterium]
MAVYHEAARDIPVYAECDILVVGAGAAGQAAALAAARAGAKNIILLERYGYMGGDATGGYVVMLPNLSWRNKSFVRGIQEEWFTRSAKEFPGSVLAPSLDEIGSTDPALLHRWRAIHDCVSRGTFGGCKESMLVRAPYFDPQYMRIVFDEMIHEERDRIQLLYHSWGVTPIVENKVIKGVIFESKEGRKAILAKQVIDATGDGDIYCQSGAEFQTLADAVCRSSTTSLVYRIGGINWDNYYEWQLAHPDVVPAFKEGLMKVAGFRILPLPTNDNTVCWMNNWHTNRDCSNVKDLTDTEVNTRLTIDKVIQYMREAVPVAFRNAYLYDIAPQAGVRCSRRLQGEYIMHTDDFAFAKKHDDVIAWHSTICQINDCGPVEIPLGAITAKGCENLLAPGRHLSADNIAIDWLNLIPQCTGTGQAAGVAAAVAVLDGTDIHHVNVKKVQDILAGEQDVPLPRNEHTDKSYTDLVEEFEYGLYTDAAKKAKAEGEEYVKGFRQDTNYKTGENESLKN